MRLALLLLLLGGCNAHTHLPPPTEVRECQDQLTGMTYEYRICAESMDRILDRLTSNNDVLRDRVADLEDKLKAAVR